MTHIMAITSDMIIEFADLIRHLPSNYELSTYRFPVSRALLIQYRENMYRNMVTCCVVKEGNVYQLIETGEKCEDPRIAARYIASYIEKRLAQPLSDIVDIARALEAEPDYHAPNRLLEAYNTFLRYRETRRRLLTIADIVFFATITISTACRYLNITLNDAINACLAKYDVIARYQHADDEQIYLAIMKRLARDPSRFDNQ